MSSSTALQAKSASPRREQLLTLELKPVVYALAWLFIVSFHAVCGAYLICVAMAYWYLTKGIMPFYVANWSLTGTTNYKFYGVVFGMVGAMHGVRVLMILALSIKSRQLSLRSEIGIMKAFFSTRFLSSHLTRSSENFPNTSSASRPRLSGTFALIWNNVFSRRGIFGVESEHFSTVFTLREVLEASSQTYQAYRASNLLPRAGLNAIIVGLLVTNCWTTAAIQFFLRKSPALERVVTLTYDASISFGMMAVVPLVIFVPYVQAFNLKYQAFKDGQWMYNPVSVTKLVLENRLIFAAGLFDFSTKLIPQFSIFLSLVTVSELLGRSDVKVIPGAGEQAMQSVAVRPKNAKTGEANGTVQKSSIGAPNSGLGGGLSVLNKWKHTIAIAVFVVWGATILLLHCAAAIRAANSEVVGCRAVTRPWFSNGKETCSSLVYDCNDWNTVSPDENSFDKLDHDALATLAITNCAELQMPTAIQSFNSMMTFTVYNSTIVRWEADSSISATAHTRLLSVLIGKTNMTEIPPGLLQPLPAATVSLQFSETNLTTLPTDLYVRWHPLAVIAFENGILTDIPYQMFFSPVYSLSFLNNKIETIPTLAMMPPGMIIPQLQLKDNPLKELPATLMDPTPFVMSINVQNTNLTAIPAWVKTNTQVIWAYGTPFCAAPMADPTLAYQVMCFPRPVEQEANFPTALYDRLFLHGKAE